MGIVTDLQPLATDTVVADLGTENERGKWTTGTQTNLTKCYVEMEAKRRVDSNGNEIMTRGSVFSLEDNSLFHGTNASRQSYRYTLPADIPDPREELEAVDIIRMKDDEGEVYEEIVF